MHTLNFNPIYYVTVINEIIKLVVQLNQMKQNQTWPLLLKNINQTVQLVITVHMYVFK